MPSVFPPFLKPSDTIAIVATARCIDAHVIRQACEIIEKQGYNVELGKNLFKKHHQFAGTATERLSDLQWAIDSPHVKAIFCARGGYGTVQLIDNVNFQSLRQYPKWVVGFSDVTILLQHLQVLGIASIHGNMPVLFGHEHANETNQSVFDILKGEPKPIPLPNHQLNKSGNTTGILTGGNLTLLQQMIGTPTEVDTRGKILYIEEVDEYLYHIDRMMWHLARSKKLQHLAALVVGSFSKMNDNQVPYGQNAYEIIYEHVKNHDYPVYFDAPIGHDFPNYAVVNGGRYDICNGELVWNYK